MKTILIVFGTRPEAIKLAPLILELISYKSYFNLFICVTGQHRDLLDEVLDIFAITPHFNLEVMVDNQHITHVVSSVISGVSDIIIKTKPDLILVHGDTATAAGAALAGFYSNVTVGHVEAGLRTFDVENPFPEEFNRQVISKAATWNFAPTILNRDNLVKEYKNRNDILVTGNTVVDALQWIVKKIDTDHIKRQQILRRLNSEFAFDELKDSLVLVTSHRRESFNRGMFNICDAIRTIAENNSNFNYVFPVHPNPNVVDAVKTSLAGCSNIYLISSLPYDAFLYLLSAVKFVMTDSGGIQEEAPSLGVPVFVMREVTERHEAIKTGSVQLVGTNRESIVEKVQSSIDSGWVGKSQERTNPYGDGAASRRIVEFLIERLVGDNEVH